MKITKEKKSGDKYHEHIGGYQSKINFFVAEESFGYKQQ